MSKTTVTHDPAAQTFTMRKREWSNTYPLEDLPKWLAFYRRMLDEHKQPSYAADVEALEGLAAKLGVRA